MYFYYTYDAVGNRLEEESFTGVTEYAYDDANRLATVGSQAYTWDSNGNMLSDGEYTYTYNHANKLVSVTDGTNTYSYTYNGDGDRTSTTTNGTVQSYVLDLNAGLTQTLSDGTYDYVYGYVRISQVGEDGEAYFLGDQLGSVRNLVDEDGAVTLTRSYEPYGDALVDQGDGDTSYGFTGEWQESTGLMYLRARYYSLSIGRFTSRDTWIGNDHKPMSTNRWLYVYGNPVLLTDPTGLDAGCTGMDCALVYKYYCEHHNTPTPTPPIPTIVEKTAYLTFDDGPSQYTVPIAQKLQEEGMKATFFVVGTDDPNDWNTDNWRVNMKFSGEYIVNYLSSLGDAIGIHSWYHYNYWDQAGADPSRDIAWVEEQLINTMANSGDTTKTNFDDKLIRATGGRFGDVPYDGYEDWFYYGWNINSGDSVEGVDTSEQVISYLQEDLSSKNYPDNAIILFHDIKASTSEAILNGNLLEKLRTKEFGSYTKFEVLPRPGDSSGVLLP